MTIITYFVKTSLEFVPHVKLDQSFKMDFQHIIEFFFNLIILKNLIHKGSIKICMQNKQESMRILALKLGNNPI